MHSDRSRLKLNKGVYRDKSKGGRGEIMYAPPRGGEIFEL